MIVICGRNEVMGSVGSLRYRQGMRVQSTQTRGKGQGRLRVPRAWGQGFQ